MSELLLYFNERCLPFDCGNEFKHFEGIRLMVSTFEKAFERNNDAKIGILRLHWLGPNVEDALSHKFRKALAGEKTRYQRLIKKIKLLEDSDLNPMHEVHFEDAPAIGLGLADVAATNWLNGWALSYSADHAKWGCSSISAERYVLDNKGEMNGPTTCSIGNLAVPDHIDEWEKELRDWGQTVAPSAVLGYLGSHPIVMYSAPLEHNPPHIHLRQSANHAGDIAKYRIEDGIREKGKPKWDREMKEWIFQHREHLLKSWERCQRGGHPYQLTEPSPAPL